MSKDWDLGVKFVDGTKDGVMEVGHERCSTYRRILSKICVFCQIS